MSLLLLRHSCLLQDLCEDFWVVESKLGERLTIKSDLRLLECWDEQRVLRTIGTEDCADTNVPERTECALLELAISVRVLVCLDNSLFRLLHCRSLHAAVTANFSLEGLDTTMPMNTTLYTHTRKVKRLEGWDKILESMLIRFMHELRTIEVLLTLALLHEQVILAVSIERKLP